VTVLPDRPAIARVTVQLPERWVWGGGNLCAGFVSAMVSVPLIEMGYFVFDASPVYPLCGMPAGTLVQVEACPFQTAALDTEAVLSGGLGIEGGPYPGGFHPTAGSVEVEFHSHPLVLDKRVGSSGGFSIRLSPGTYTVLGCGPGSSSDQCSKPRAITLRPGEIDHISLVWAYAP